MVGGGSRGLGLLPTCLFIWTALVVTGSLGPARQTAARGDSLRSNPRDRQQHFQQTGEIGLPERDLRRPDSHQRAQDHYRRRHHYQRAALKHWPPTIQRPNRRTSGDDTYNGRGAHGRARGRRQALDLAFERLKILESLDAELRAFARAPSPARPPSSAPPVSPEDAHTCQLYLDFGSEAPADHFRRRQTGRRSCWASERLARQVPPYMSNLQRQLLAESQSLAEAVRLMPYQSLVARSFRQPRPAAPLGPNLARGKYWPQTQPKTALCHRLEWAPKLVGLFWVFGASQTALPVSHQSPAHQWRHPKLLASQLTQVDASDMLR